jgi:hypothetical protein
MEVAMTASLVPAKDNYWVGAGRDVVKQFLDLSEMVCAGAKIAAEKRCRPGLDVR